MYQYGLTAYAESRFSEAGECFEFAGEYELAPVYYEACSIYNNVKINSDYMGINLPRLEELSKQIDVSGILLSDKFLGHFLEGSWTSTNGGGNFWLSLSEGEFKFSNYPFPGKYNFSNKAIVSDTTGEAAVTIQFVSYDELIMTFEDGRTYTFRRQ